MTASNPERAPGLLASDWVVELTIAQAVTRAERAFAFVRAGFCASVLALFFVTNDSASPAYGARLGLELLVFAIGTGFSAWMLHRTRQGLLGEWTLRVSVAVDAGLCAMDLATNMLVSGDAYVGVLESLDVAVVPLVITSSIFRVSRGAALTSGGVSLLGLGCLLGVEAWGGRVIPLDKALLMTLYLLAATAVALFGVRRAREIFSRVGAAVGRAERARGSVFALLEDHHDLRSILCNLQLNADRLAELENGEPSPRVRERAMVLRAQLDHGIAELGEASARTRDRALLALEGLERPAPADLALALARAAELAQQRFTHVSIRVELSSVQPPVLFAAGTEGLERLFVHLFTNAAEGDGKQGAAHIIVGGGFRVSGRVEVTVSDDGPGFSAALLKAVGRAQGTTSKVGSAGIGLWLSRSVVVAVGGRIDFANGRRGAEVRLALPVAMEPAPGARLNGRAAIDSA